MPDKLVTIATFSTLIEASIARNKLEAEGIRAFLADATTVGMVWHLGTAFGGIKLQVMEDDADRAISILETDDPAPISDGEWLSDETGDDFETEIDHADEDESVSPTEEIVARALRTAILGLIFLPLQLYSLWLLLRIARDDVPLSSADRRRVVITVILDAWMIAWMIILFMIVMMPALARVRQISKRMVSGTNLSAVGKALLIYANDHNDQFPPNLQELVEEAELSPKSLESPLKPKDFDGPSYVYIVGQNVRMHPGNIIAYENPAFCREGVNVLYMDSHVQWMKPAEFLRELEATYKRLVKKMPEVKFKGSEKPSASSDFFRGRAGPSVKRKVPTLPRLPSTRRIYWGRLPIFEVQEANGCQTPCRNTTKRTECTKLAIEKCLKCLKCKVPKVIEYFFHFRSRTCGTS